MDVSVSIVNWNAASELGACLRSVYATAPPLRYEVIVVDNDSDDDSVDVVAGFPRARLVRNGVNLGFGRAQNQALKMARGRYAVLLNNDAEVEPETIPTLVRFMDEHPDVAVCGCPERRQTTLGSAYAGAFPRFPSLGRTILENLWAVFRPPEGWDVGWLANPVHRWMGEAMPRTDHAEVAWIVGSLLCVRKEVFDQVGGFDERFFLFDEDIDFCQRVWAAGWKVAFTTNTRFAHEGGVSSARRQDIERIRGDSRELYFRKRRRSGAALLVRIQHTVLRRWLLPLRRGSRGIRRPASAHGARLS